MLKGKSGTYILLTVVAVLWGVLIYKFASDLSDDPVAANQIQVTSFKAPNILEKEAITLLPVEKDPFLGTSYGPKETSQKNESQKIVKETTPWPQIKYKGSVQGQKNSSYVISINGRDYIMSRGETMEEVSLVRANATSATLKFKGGTKKFEL